MPVSDGKHDQIKRVCRITVSRPINIGLVCVNGPVFGFLIGFPGLVLLLTKGMFELDTRSSNPFVFSSMLVGLVLAWLWWSFTVPKWRLWAYERVGDIDALKEQAVQAGLTWPDGSFFEKTEIKSREHAERERELERRQR